MPGRNQTLLRLFCGTLVASVLCGTPVRAQQPQGAGRGSQGSAPQSGQSGSQENPNPPRRGGNNEQRPPAGPENPVQPLPQAAPVESLSLTKEDALRSQGNAVSELKLAPGITPALTERILALTPPLPAGPFQPTWESLQAGYRTPDWFRDGKFGIMIHWGPYSVAAYHDEWYQRYVYGNEQVRAFHQKTFGPLNRRGYVSLIEPLGAKFKPDEWAELARKAGAAYVVPVAEHHDGFSLWDSQANPWNAARTGPKRDIIAELAREVRARGMKFGVSHHSLEHYQFISAQPPGGEPHDLDVPEFADFYWTRRDEERQALFLRQWTQKNLELIGRYQPDLLLLDRGASQPALDPLKLYLAAAYYNLARQQGKEVTLSARGDVFRAGSVPDFERQASAPAELAAVPWQVDDPIGETYGYTAEDRGHGDRERDMAVGRPGTYITKLVQNVSRNGNYLLNISPRGDGTIPENQQKVLTAIGNWLQINGEAIFGTRPWTVSEEGSVHFTTKGDVLYVLPVRAPGRLLTVPLLKLGHSAGKIAKVELLGTAGPLNFVQDETGLKVDLPESAAENAPFALKVSGLKLR